MSHTSRRIAEIARIFLRLGCSCFGGPVAHLGYFYDEFVMRRKWLDAREYADLVALCQVLPGPASSQVVFALGLRRAGVAGALTAAAGFTMPSAVLMMGFAFLTGRLGAAQLQGAGWLHGLKICAVAVVALAVVNMARKLCADVPRACIGAVAAAGMLWLGGASAWGQVGAIVFGGVSGKRAAARRVSSSGFRIRS